MSLDKIGTYILASADNWLNKLDNHFVYENISNAEGTHIQSPKVVWQKTFKNKSVLAAHLVQNNSLIEAIKSKRKHRRQLSSQSNALLLGHCRDRHSTDKVSRHPNVNANVFI